jgi:hypothetical protein
MEESYLPVDVQIEEEMELSEASHDPATTTNGHDFLKDQAYKPREQRFGGPLLLNPIPEVAHLCVTSIPFAFLSSVQN